ncbi:PQ loop repeat protein [Entamoeba nuttalli P19]|uniref:PQ loop repeat protein n=1 Tax=Entamoeba nuttalli (strain P19) TaxID=1076696 RepID=K2H311_ENTNP|nr:PQ loop repeat protein [Entamoeba nuttalli P19]EKE41908.1 PQ loop repeat protein [Entamoeba nuttalli P19]|eukprot:XP_008855755.1 PQ loop repeat protein [Entamoeba nuttalli P19]
MIVMPILPYTQFFISHNNQQQFKSFSIGTCYILLISNVLRIGFYIGEPFEISLLIQSIFIIITMLILIFLSSKLLHNLIYSKVITTFILFTSIVIFVSFVTRKINLIVQCIGGLSTIIEILLGFPQILKNYKTKNAEGLPLSTIGGWIIGDFFKTVYFIELNVPLQFVCCGVFQLICDGILVSQILVYSPFIFEKQCFTPLKQLFKKGLITTNDEQEEDYNGLLINDN